MRIFVFLCLFTCAYAQATEYGNYDAKRILKVTETPTGSKYGIDTEYLDQVLNDLGRHAKNYPPQFDTPPEKSRAVQDVKMLSGMLNILINNANPNPEILWRAGFLNSMGLRVQPKKRLPFSKSCLRCFQPIREATICMARF